MANISTRPSSGVDLSLRSGDFVDDMSTSAEGRPYAEPSPDRDQLPSASTSCVTSVLITSGPFTAKTPLGQRHEQAILVLLLDFAARCVRRPRRDRSHRGLR